MLKKQIQLTIQFLQQKIKSILNFPIAQLKYYENKPLTIFAYETFM